MIRKQLYITEPQQDLITIIRLKMGRTEAEVIRLILDKGIDAIKKELEEKK